MEDKRIEAVKDWPEPKSVRDIQVFLGFANFYQWFIQGFSKIAAPFISMLKTTGSSVELAPIAIGANVDEVVEGGGGSKPFLPKSKKTKMTKSKNFAKSKNPANLSKKADTNVRVTGLLTPKARETFTQLRQAFIKAPILRHFDPECHIRIETDAFDYAIGEVLSQLTSDQVTLDHVTLDPKWQPVAYFSKKMLPAKTRYKTHDGELLAIVEAIKTWRNYLKDCKHKVLVLTDYNNLSRFMDTKSLTFCQVHRT